MEPLRPLLSKTATSGRRAPWGHEKSGLSIWALLGAFTGAFLALTVNMPAQWLAKGLIEATKGQVQLQEAQGSVWQGSGKLVLTGGAGSRDALALPGRVNWQMNVSWLGSRLPSLNLKLQADCCMTQGLQMHVTSLKSFSAWQLQVDDHHSEWPAQWLNGLGSPWNTLQPEGRLMLETQQLVIQSSPQGLQMVGHLNLTAHNVSTQLSTLKPLGTYQLSWVSDATHATPPTLNLRTQSGSLLLSGQGQWQGTHFQFRGEASAVPEHAAALSNLLNIIGRRQGARSLLSLG